MPAKFCSGEISCDVHKDKRTQEEEQRTTDFLVIGNGPSGISLSYLLSGNWPYYVGESHDDMLHARLMGEPELSLVEQDLEFLSEGLEGRSNNPVSLLLDCLQRPQADHGLDLTSNLDWRQDLGRKVDHVVLGRGKPGGVWQTLDGNLKTVSLGAWMQLPNLSMPEWEEHNTALVNRRTSVSNVAQYYMDYVDIMGLTQNFRSNTVVTRVKQIDINGFQPDLQKCGNLNKSELSRREASVSERLMEAPQCRYSGEEEVFSLEDDELSSQCSSLTQHSSSPSRDTEPREYNRADCCSVGRWSTDRESPSPCSCVAQPCDYVDYAYPGSHRILASTLSELCPSWDPIINPSLFSLPRGLSDTPRGSYPLRNSFRACSLLSRSLSCPKRQEKSSCMFEVSGYELSNEGTGQTEMKYFKYLAKNVVLATGLDKPNRLGIPGEELSFVIHNLRDLEKMIESGGLTPNSDPIMIIGAGLSAADAIISVQGYNIPLVHVFRRSVDDPQLIFNKLPVKLYPEYHMVHKMMSDGSVERSRLLRGEQIEHEHPKYRAFSETDIQYITKDRRVQLTGPFTNTQIQVSCVLVLIGASPRLEFLETDTQLGRIPDAPIDKNNPIDVDVFTHQSVNVPGLFAMGPLVGDNFVRFLQGGALAIASFAHKQRAEEN